MLIFYTDQDKKQKQDESRKYEKAYYPLTVIVGNLVKMMSSMFVRVLIHKISLIRKLQQSQQLSNGRVFYPYKGLPAIKGYDFML